MLHNFVCLYVPDTLQGNTKAGENVHLEAVRKVASELSAKFGGATVTQALGYWVSDAHGLIEDKISQVKSYYDTGTVSSADAITLAREIAERLKVEFSQEAVTLETEEGIDFI